MVSSTPAQATASPQSLFYSSRRFVLSDLALAGLAAAWAIPAAWATERATAHSAEAMMWMLVGAWIGWRLWLDWPAHTKAPGRLAVALLALWAGIVWIIAGSWPEDYWLVRIAYPAGFTGFIFILWGWRAVFCWGWRAVLAGFFWSLAPLSGQLAGPRGGDWLREITATSSAWGLWLCGVDAGHHGSYLTSPHGTLLVGLPCTAQPLAETLLRLLLPAALVFGLPWTRTLLLGALVVVGSLALSILRTMLLAVIVNDTPRFDYWHVGTGSDGFTVAAMAALAIGLGVLLPQKFASAEPALPASSRSASFWTLTILVSGAILAALSPLRTTQSGRSDPTETARWMPPVATSWTVRELPGAFPPNTDPWVVQLAWMRTFVYTAPDGLEIRVHAAALPLWLDGDPVAIAGIHGWIAPETPERWPAQVLADGRVVRALQSKETIWLATLDAKGRVSATTSQWLQQTKALPSDLKTWVAWGLGRAPLRDKRGLCLALEWIGPGAPDENRMMELLTLWQQQAASML